MKAEKQIEMHDTQYGFRYGSALVERCASQKGYVIVGVKTKRQRLEMTITPSGLIRVGKITKNLEK